MTIRRRSLNVGVFLIAAGAVMLAAQAGAIDSAFAADALRLWPLVIVAIGIGLVLRHTSLGLPGGILAAAMPGLLLGGLVVAAPEVGTPCGGPAQGTTTTRDGSFGASAAVTVRLACGELNVTTQPGSGWQLDAGDGPLGAIISSSADRLSVTSTTRSHGFDALRAHDTWDLRLPTATTLDLDARVDAGKGTLDLAGARLGRLTVGVNAGQALIDLTGATVTHLELDANAASASVRLPAGSDLIAHATVNAGSLQVCAPAGLGLRVHATTALGAATYGGLVHAGDAWETPGYSTAPFHADVTISAAVGSVDVNPEGGCK